MMTVKKNARPDSGLTMIEVIIASIILTALVTMSSYLVWNTSRTVSSSEVGVQMEVQAREFINQLTKELHQSSFKYSYISSVNWDTSLTVLPAVLNSTGPTPGTASNYATVLSTYFPFADSSKSLNSQADMNRIPDGTWGVWPPNASITPVPAAKVFSAIRFRIPGSTLDLTTKNASHDGVANAGNFDLKAYKAASVAGGPPPDYTTEIQYWFEFDQTGYKNEGSTSGTGPIGPGGFRADGVDNNTNGVIDEGIIKRLETTYDVNGNVLKRKMSTVLRDVQWDAANNRPGLVFCIPKSDASFKDYAPGSEQRVFVSVTMERSDPQYPKLPNRNFVKQVATYIDVRN